MSLSLGTGVAEENANLQNTSNLLDNIGQLIYLPDAVLARTVALASGDVPLGQQSLERRINDVEILVCFERALIHVLTMGHSSLTDGRVRTAKFLESGQDLVRRDWDDFDRDVFPGLKETGLQLPRVWDYQRNARGREIGVYTHRRQQ